MVLNVGNSDRNNCTSSIVTILKREWLGTDVLLNEVEEKLKIQVMVNAKKQMDLLQKRKSL